MKTFKVNNRFKRQKPVRLYEESPEQKARHKRLDDEFGDTLLPGANDL